MMLGKNIAYDFDTQPFRLLSSLAATSPLYIV